MILLFLMVTQRVPQKGVLGEGKSIGEELGKTHCLLRTLWFPQR